MAFNLTVGIDDEQFEQAIQESVRHTLGGVANPAHYFDMEDYARYDQHLDVYIVEQVQKMGESALHYLDFEKYATVEKVTEMIAERTQTASDAIDEAVTEALDDRLINAIEEALDNVIEDRVRDSVRYLYMDGQIASTTSVSALEEEVDALRGMVKDLNDVITRLKDVFIPKPATEETTWPGRVSWATPHSDDTNKGDDLNA